MQAILSKNSILIVLWVTFLFSLQFNSHNALTIIIIFNNLRQTRKKENHQVSTNWLFEENIIWGCNGCACTYPYTLSCVWQIIRVNYHVVWIGWQRGFKHISRIRLCIVNKGTGYDVRQTSKEQTKMPRFRLEGPQPCKIFCSALIHYAWVS